MTKLSQAVVACISAMIMLAGATFIAVADTFTYAYAHKSLIWFTVWSSVVHAAIMGVQALSDPAERGHLVGDVPALILVAIILAVLMPRGLQKVESGPHTVPA